jgi:hypothetical protein
MSVRASTASCAVRVARRRLAAAVELERIGSGGEFFADGGSEVGHEASVAQVKERREHATEAGIVGPPSSAAS